MWSRLGRKAGGRRYKLGKRCMRVFINKRFLYAPGSELGVNVTPGGVHLTLEHRLSSQCVFFLSQNLVHLCPNSLGTLTSS